MLARLIQFALTQRLLMLLVVALLIGGGWRAVQLTPIDAFPDVSTTQVKIIVKAPGMTPEEVAARITSLIEVEMLGLPRQTMLRSIAKYALTDITIDFAEGTDIVWARQQVAERLNSVWGNLPAGIEGGIAPMTTPLGESSCSASRAVRSVSPNGATCSTGPSVPPCARCPAWPTSTRSAVS